MSFCGSLAYLAPEMIEKKGHGYALDWYLLGICIYEMLDGQPPFFCNDKAKLIRSIKNTPLKPPKHASSALKKLIV